MIQNSQNLPLIIPRWPAPAGVKSAITCAAEPSTDCSPFGAFNLAAHVGDDACKVAACRRQLASQLQVARWQWLNQVHGTEVVPAQANGHSPNADASFTRQRNMACAILTADCLPILVCNSQGSQVAAAHAGWRGLAAGVLEATCSTFARSDTLMAYLGPAISQRAFEVGEEVRTVFMQCLGARAGECFIPHCHKKAHYFADLYALARIKLGHLGVQHVYGGGECTVNDTRFYSYRRQNITGRFASVIWLED